jgi:type II secretory pathway component PulF
MSATASPRISVFSALSHVLDLFVAGAVIFTAGFIIPRFAKIFDDMLGGQELPPVTEFVLHFRVLWLLLGWTFLFAAIYLAWRYRLQSAPPLVSAGFLFFSAVQIGFIVIALFLPLGTIIRQMPPTP